MSMKKTVYYLSARKNESYLLKTYLNNEGIEMSIFSGEKQLLDGINEEGPTLVLLDETAANESWITTVREIRAKSSVPLIMCMGSDEAMTRIAALSLGVDICIDKNMMPVELVAYIKAMIRRSESYGKDAPSGTLRFGDIYLSENEHSAHIGDTSVNLTPNEFEFLTYMIKKDSAVSKEELLKAIWKTDDRYLLTHVAEDLVKRLRKKLKKYRSNVAIESVWGFGYRLAISEPSEGGEGAAP